MDDLFSLVAEEFTARSAQIRRYVGTHGPTIGAGHEVLLRSFLRDYLPTWVTVAHGMVRDHTGAMTGQIDLLIFNSTQFAPLYRIDDFVVIPPEAVVATIEVKTSVNKRDFAHAMQQLARNKVIAPSALTGLFIFHPPSASTLKQYLSASGLESVEDETIPDVLCALRKCYIERANLVLPDHANPENPKRSAIGFMQFDYATGRPGAEATFGAFFYRVYSHVEQHINNAIKSGIDNVWRIEEGEPVRVPGRRRFSPPLESVNLFVEVKTTKRPDWEALSADGVDSVD